MGIYNTNVAAGAAQPYYAQAGQALQAGLAGAAPMAYAGAMPVMPGQLGGQQIGQYMSPYLGSVVGTTMAAQAQQNAQQRVAMQGQAIQQGAFGGDRANIGQANLAYQQDLANSQTLANLMNQGYGQALTTAQQQQQLGLSAEQANRAALQQQAQNLYGMYGGYGQALAGLGTGAQQAALQGAQAQLAAGQAQQQTAQAGLAAMYNQFQQQQSYPFQVAQFLANIAMGTGALSGSTTTTTQPAPLFSDRRLKHDVHEIGKTKDGLPIYSFKYNGDDKTQIGLMAQDVEKKHPEAVGLAGGYKTVDYDKATEGSRKAYGGGLSSMGGAVGLEHAGLGFERGGYLDGGLVSSQDLQAILAKQQEQFPGYAQMGRGLGGLPHGGKSYVPGGGIHVPAGPITSKVSTQQQPTGMQQLEQAMKTVETGEKLYNSGEKAFNWAKGLTQSPGASANEAYGKMSPEEFAATAPIPPVPPEVIPPRLAYRGGLIRAHREDGGLVDDQDKEKDTDTSTDSRINFADKTSPEKESYGKIFSSKLDIPDDSQHGGLNPAQTPAFQSPNFLKDTLQPIASMASMIPSDRRLKENIEHVGKTFDGQNIYKYNYKGEPRTRIGLIAQEVQRHHPNAVGSNHGYKTVDYDAATEDAARRGHFYQGGLAPRHGYATDGEVRDAAPEQPDIFSVMDRFEGRSLTPSPGVRGAGAAGFGQVIPKTYADWASKYRSEHPWMPATHEEYHRSPEDVQRRVYSEVVLPREYKPALESAGLGVTPVNVAAVNFLGPAGGTSFLKAAQENPNAPASSIVSPSAVANNKNVFIDKSTGQERTVGEVLNYIAGQRDTSSPRPSGLTAARPEAPPEAPARQEAGLAPRQASMMLADASAPSMGGGLGAMEGVVREARPQTWSERHREWLLPLISGVGSMLASPSTRLGGALGAGLIGAAQGMTKAQELEQAQQQRDVSQQQQNLGVTRLKADYEAMQRASALNAFDEKTKEFIIYGPDNRPIRISAQEFLSARDRGKYYRIYPNGLSEVLGLNRSVAPAPNPKMEEAVPTPPSSAAPEPPKPPGAQGTEPPKPTAALPPNVATFGKHTEAKTPTDYSFQIPIGSKGQEILNRERTYTRTAIPSPEESKTASSNINDAIKAASAAQENRSALLELAQTAITPEGILATGPGSDARAKLVQIANLALRMVGADPNSPDGRTLGQLDDREIANKLMNAQVQARSQQMGERAVSALHVLAAGMPNQNLSPETLRKMIADLLVFEQRKIDLGAYAARYRSQDAGPWQVGRDVVQAFNTDYGADHYLKERDALIQAMEPTQVGERKTYAFREITNPNVTPVVWERRFGPGTYRYITGGVQ
jgi:hypothetical protein